jgi:hypothetical protein
MAPFVNRRTLSAAGFSPVFFSSRSEWIDLRLQLHRLFLICRLPPSWLHQPALAGQNCLVLSGTWRLRSRLAVRPRNSYVPSVGPSKDGIRCVERSSGVASSTPGQPRTKVSPADFLQCNAEATSRASQKQGGSEHLSGRCSSPTWSARELQGSGMVKLLIPGFLPAGSQGISRPRR